MEDSGTSPAPDKPELLSGKEPAAQSTTFFTEELYRQFTGPVPTLEESVSQLMDALGYDPPSHIANSSSRRSMHRARPSTRRASSVASSDSKGKDDIFTHPSSELCRAKKEKVTSSDARSEQQIVEQQIPGETASAEEDNVNSVPAPDSAVLLHEATLSVPEKEELSAAPQNTEPAPDDKRYPSVSQKEETFGSLGAVSGGSSSDSVQSQRAEKPAEHGERSGDLDSRPQTTVIASDDPERTLKGIRPPMPESRKSSLSHEQHVRYLELFKKCTKRFLTGVLQPPTEEELQELKEFEKLQVMVAKEQEDCQNYLKQLAQYNPFLYVNLPSHVMKYIQDKDESNWRRADSYAHYYNQHAMLPLTVSALSVTGPPMLMLVQTLVQLGSKCRLHMPDLNPNPTAKPKRTVPMDVHKISSRFPPVRDSKQHAPSGSAWNHEPASKDSNMESLAHKYQCHIATSVSVIQQLLDNHAPNFSAEWDIPVVVRDYKQGSASHKVVYLDKPLLPRGLGQCQRKTHFLQKAVRAYMCQPHNDRVTAVGKARTVGQKGQGSGQESEGPGRKDCAGRAPEDVGHREVGGGAGSHDDDDPFGAAVSMEDLETFGSDRLFSQSGWKMPDQKPQTLESALKTRTDKDTDDKNTEFATGKVPASAGDEQNTNRVDLSTTVTEPSQHSSARGAEPVSKSNDCSEVAAQETKDSSPSKVCALSHQSSNTHGLDPSASSDSEDDGLVIADVETPDTKQSGGSTGGPTQSLRRASRSSRSSIFDEVAVPPANTAQSPVDVTPRRVTRSVAHKLQSPESPTVSTAAESPARATRQAAKRKLQEQSQVEDRGDSVESQSPESSECKGSKTEASSTKPSSSAQLSSSAEPSPSAKKSKQTGVVAAHAAEVAPKSGPGRGVDQSLAKPADQAGERGAVSSKGGHSQVGKSAGGKQGVKKEAVSATPLDSIMKEMAPSGDRTSLKFQAEDPSQYHQPLCTGDHVSYHLWNLSGISVMIRCNNHAFIRDMRQQQKGVYLRAKAERQVQYGLEQVTLSECVRAWLGCYLRPNSYLLRARVNMQTQEVVHVEELQLDQILQPSLNFSPQCAFAVLQNVFSALMELPAGSYLLSHEAGSDHIQLRAGTGSKRGAFDLRCGYMGLGVVKERDREIPWVPIDPTLVLPHHWRLGLIPATFQPPDFDSKRKQQQRQFSGPKKKNKNKNKNKMRTQN